MMSKSSERFEWKDKVETGFDIKLYRENAKWNNEEKKNVEKNICMNTHPVMQA